MFFNKPKSFFQSIIGVLVLLILSSCSDYLGGKPKKQEELQIKSDELNCLVENEDVFQKYIAGESNAESIRAYSSCVQKALNLFAERTRGADQSEYTADELYRLFSRYVIKSESFHVSLVEHILKLKFAFIGGTDKVLKKSEISTLNNLIQNLEKEVISLSKYAPILAFYRSSNAVSKAELKEAVTAFRQSLTNLFKAYEFERSSYSFDNFTGLVRSISQLLRKPGYDKHLQLVERVKDIYFGPPMNLSNKKEWLSAVNGSIEIYSLGLQYYYLMSGRSIKEKTNLREFASLLTQVIASLKQTSSMKFQGSIPYASIDEIINLTNELSPGALKISTKTLKNIYRVTLARTQHAMGEVSSGDALSREALQFLSSQFELWKVAQFQIDNVFEGQQYIAKEQFIGPLKSKFSADTQRFFAYDFSKPNSILWTPAGLPLVARTRKAIALNWYGLTFQNMIRTMNRLLLLGYGDGKIGQDPWTMTLSEQGLVSWYKEFDLLGKELKWFDPRSKGSGQRSFKEANFFTYSSDGVGNLTSHESFEFLSLLFGGGLGNTRKVVDLMNAKACAVAQLDVFGLNMYNEACFRKNLSENYASLFANLPGQVKYFQSLSESEKNNFYQDVMGAARVSDPKLGLVETSDYRTMIMILLYNESLFTEFDKDVSGDLTVKELKLASKRFLEFFTKLSPVKNELFVEQVFLYVAFHGKKPDFTALSKFEGQMAWNYITDKKMSIDRKDLVKVFATLKEALKNNP